MDVINLVTAGVNPVFPLTGFLYVTLTIRRAINPGHDKS